MYPARYRTEEGLTNHAYRVWRLSRRRQPHDTGAASTAWAAEKLAALLTDRIGDALGALKRMRLRQPTVRQAWEDALLYGLSAPSGTYPRL